VDNTLGGSAPGLNGISGESLEERVRFEELLANLSARFVNLPPERIDSEIADAQRRICELLDVDRSTLWQVSEREPRAVLLTHVHQPPGIQKPPEHMDGRDFFPWTVQQVLGGETLVISSISDLPAEGGRDLESYRAYGTKSVALFPLSVGGEPVFGLLGFAVVGQERNWPKTVLRGFKLIAQVFANALARGRAEKALSEREARLTLATNIAGVGLWIMELDTLEVWASEKTREMFRFSTEEELSDQSFLEVMHPDDREGVNEAVQRTVQSGDVFQSDYRIVLADGSIRWIRARGHRYPSADPVRLMGVSLDITSQKRDEAEASAVREQLQHSERLLRMGQLTASIAHELNQPLASILFNAEAALRLAETDSLDADTLREILKDIAQDDKRAGEIIRGIRSMFKHEAGEREAVAINQVLREVLGLLKSEAVFRNLQLETEFSELLPRVTANKTQVQQVVINLIMNAAESIPDGSEDRRITLRTQRSSNGYVQVSVSDTGSGIDEQDLASIFEPTFTTKSSGLGLGLSLSRAIIESHSGGIRAQNNPDRGATLIFELPATGDRDAD
jgi:two-component system sensor kinase FixL